MIFHTRSVDDAPARLIDTHIHFGQFYDRYFSFEYVNDCLARCGVSHFVYTTTTTCEDNYRRVLKELTDISRQGYTHAFPGLWLTESGLSPEILDRLLDSGVRWSYLKIHPALRPDEWASGGDNIGKLLSLPRLLEIPLLIHTGEDECCHAARYVHEFAMNPDIIFILAHGRPLRQTIGIMKRYGNVFADTAFMPLQDIRELVDAGLSDRILWGSDVFLPEIYYRAVDLPVYYKSLLRSLREVCTQSQYKRITFSNAAELLRLNTG